MPYAHTTLAGGRRFLRRTDPVLDPLCVAGLSPGGWIYDTHPHRPPVYKKADDAISDIQADINKGAFIEQIGFNDPYGAEAENQISGLQVNTRKNLRL